MNYLEIRSVTLNEVRGSILRKITSNIKWSPCNHLQTCIDDAIFSQVWSSLVTGIFVNARPDELYL